MGDESGAVEFGPQLKQRVLFALDEKRHVRASEGEFWGVSLGDYSCYTYSLDGFTQEKRQSEEQLIGFEERLRDQIQHTLEAKAASNDQSPVVVLDFGGMYGLSFLRIAKAMASLVQQGRVVFVVSNLNFTLEWGLSDSGKKMHRNINEHVQFIEENKHLVHYVRADATELKRVSISINGTSLPLNGNVGIVHEDTTLTHTAKNDIDLPRLGNLLSDNGTFYLGSRNIIHDPAESKAMYESRRKVHEVGKENLLKRGLKKVDTGGVFYDVYVKPKAPIRAIRSKPAKT